MNISDDLQKLRDLHSSGALSSAEYEAAKARLLNPGGHGHGHGHSAPPPLPPSAPAPAAPYYSPPAAPLVSSQQGATRQWAMIIHLSQLAGFVIPLAGMIIPIVLWQIKKKELPGVDVHGCHATNWILTQFILAIICIPLCFIIIGIPMLIALGIVGIIFPIMAGIKASNGETWRYPMSFTFFRPQFVVTEENPAGPGPDRPHGW